MTPATAATAIYFTEEAFEEQINRLEDSPKIKIKQVDKRAADCRKLINVLASYGIDPSPYVVKLVVSFCFVFINVEMKDLH